MESLSQSQSQQTDLKSLASSILAGFHPSYYLIALWILVVFKSVESISPLVFSPTVKTASTIVFLILLIPPLYLTGHVKEKAAPHTTWILPLVAGLVG